MIVFFIHTMQNVIIKSCIRDTAIVLFSVVYKKFYNRHCTIRTLICVTTDSDFDNFVHILCGWDFVYDTWLYTSSYIIFF